MQRRFKVAQGIAGAAAILLTCQAATASSLEAIADAWAGPLSGPGNPSLQFGGCATAGPLPVLQSFFGGGGTVVLGGNTACGLKGGSSDILAVTGTAFASQSTPTVAPLNPVFGGSAQSSASASARYRTLGAAANGVLVANTLDPTVANGAGAGMFTDTLTASSPGQLASNPGFVRYAFQLDGSLSTPAMHGGEAFAQLNVQQQGDSDFEIGRLGVTSGSAGTVFGVDTNTASWTVGTSFVSGSGLFFLKEPISWDVPYTLTVGLLAATVGTGTSSFLSTAQLVGVQLFDASGKAVTDFSLTSASGTDYLHTAAVPEPSSMLLLAAGLLGFNLLARQHRRRGHG